LSLIKSQVIKRRNICISRRIYQRFARTPPPACSYCGTRKLAAAEATVSRRHGMSYCGRRNDGEGNRDFLKFPRQDSFYSN